MRGRIKFLILCAGVIVASLVGLFVYGYYQAFNVTVPNAYAVWWTADLVIAHMEKNDGRWPRSWEDLRATEASGDKGTATTNRDGSIVFEFRPRAKIDELQQRVEIDWAVEPAKLRTVSLKSNIPPFRVIRLRNGKNSHYEGKEPNTMILDYLQWKAETNSMESSILGRSSN